MVIKTEPESESTNTEAALSALRQSGKEGRVLHKAIKKLKEGKLKCDPAKIGVMAAILQLADTNLKALLMPYWVALMNPLE